MNTDNRDKEKNSFSDKVIMHIAEKAAEKAEKTALKKSSVKDTDDEMYCFEKSAILSKQAYAEYNQYKVTKTKIEFLWARYGIFILSFFLIAYSIEIGAVFLAVFFGTVACIFLLLLILSSAGGKDKKTVRYGSNMEENRKLLEKEYDNIKIYQKAVYALFYNKYVKYYLYVMTDKYKYKNLKGFIEGENFFAVRFLVRGAGNAQIKEIVFEKDRDIEKIKRLIFSSVKKTNEYKYVCSKNGKVKLKKIRTIYNENPI